MIPISDGLQWKSDQWIDRFRNSTSTWAANCPAVIGPSCDELVVAVQQYGFLTGSRALGLDTEESDWDYLVRADHVAHLLDIDMLRRGKKDYFPTMGIGVAYRSRYAGGDGVVVLNILVCETEAVFQAWSTCTAQMQWILQLHPFLRELCQTKSVRVAIFEELRRRAGLVPDDDPGTPEHPNITPFAKPVDEEEELPSELYYWNLVKPVRSGSASIPDTADDYPPF